MTFSFFLIIAGQAWFASHPFLAFPAISGTACNKVDSSLKVAYQENKSCRIFQGRDTN